MHILIPNLRINNVGRIAAILAMVVLIAGKTVHTHQECNDCCATRATIQQPDASAKTCPFGCTHHVPGESPSNNAPDQPHDEHNCTVCQLLAQAPDCPVLLALPGQPKIVVETIALRSDAAIAQALISAQPRGPPHAARAC